MSPADWVVSLRSALAFVTLPLSAGLVRQKVGFWAVFGMFTAGFLFPCHVMGWAVDDSAICPLLYKIVLIASLFTRLCCNAARFVEQEKISGGCMSDLEARKSSRLSRVLNAVVLLLLTLLSVLAGVLQNRRLLTLTHEVCKSYPRPQVCRPAAQQFS